MSDRVRRTLKLSWLIPGCGESVQYLSMLGVALGLAVGASLTVVVGEPLSVMLLK